MRDAITVSRAKQGADLGERSTRLTWYCCEQCAKQLDTSQVGLVAQGSTLAPVVHMGHRARLDASGEKESSATTQSPRPCQSYHSRLNRAPPSLPQCPSPAGPMMRM